MTVVKGQYVRVWNESAKGFHDPTYKFGWSDLWK